MSSSKLDKLSPKNSALRELAQKPVTLAVEFIAGIFPNLTPNEITVMGTLSVAALVIFVSKLEKEGKIDFETSMKLVVAFLLISAADSLDGGLARLKIKQGDKSHDPKIGQLVDSGSDRIQEWFFSAMAMFRAADQKDQAWLAVSTLTAFTNPLSSFFRAWAEAEGIVVPESGKGLVELLGTRVGKVFISIFRFMPANKTSPIPFNAIMESLVVISTLKVATSRLMAVINHKMKNKLSPASKPSLEVDGENLGLLESEEKHAADLETDLGADLGADLETDLEINQKSSQELKQEEEQMRIDAKLRLKWLGGLMIATGLATVFLYSMLKKVN